MHASTIRPAAAIASEEACDLDNPAMTRLLHLGIATVIGTTLVVFHSALFAMAGSALPLV